MGKMKLFLCKEQAPVFQGGLCFWGGAAYASGVKWGSFFVNSQAGLKEAEKGLIRILPRKHRQEWPCF